ncbi:cytochrome P450 [Artemisia annua]|uniref:Cytochrome P450 n=1 Tax=Artemisia annua TaxID=35608 RepID=A0A2U1PG80_ARTAN|nr:cytochrome P450 [Artemisia annua]
MAISGSIVPSLLVFGPLLFNDLRSSRHSGLVGRESLKKNKTFTTGEVTVLLASLLLLFLFFRTITGRNFSKKPPLPPGPYPWLIIGNIFQIGKNAHVHLAEMAKVHGPLMSLRLGQQTLIIGSSSIAASEILKTYDHVLSGRYVSRLLQNKKPTIHNMNLAFTSNCDDGWRNLRNLYKTELFSGKALDSSVNIRENKVIEMVKYLASKKGECKVIKDVVFVTSMNILGNASLSIDLVDFEGNGVGARIMSSLGDVWVDSLQSKHNRSNISSYAKDFTDILIEKGFTNQQINPLMENSRVHTDLETRNNENNNLLFTENLRVLLEIKPRQTKSSRAQIVSNRHKKKKRDMKTRFKQRRKKRKGYT